MSVPILWIWDEAAQKYVSLPAVGQTVRLSSGLSWRANNQ